MRVIYENIGYRIIEKHDTDYDMENLKGDTYNPEVNSDIPSGQIEREEREFEDLVSREGVFGYVLEKWNPEVGKGWEQIDSCWGFVGQYTPGEEVFNHYIVNELKNQIPKDQEQ